MLLRFTSCALHGPPLGIQDQSEVKKKKYTALFSVGSVLQTATFLRITKDIVISQPIVLPPGSARRILLTTSSLSPLIGVTRYDILFVRKQKCRKGGLPFSYYFNVLDIR